MPKLTQEVLKIFLLRSKKTLLKFERNKKGKTNVFLSFQPFDAVMMITAFSRACRDMRNISGNKQNYCVVFIELSVFSVLLI